MFQEYPKALYQAGAQRVVDDLDQEDAAREDGRLDWHDDHARLSEPAVDLTKPDADPLDREALKAKAAELGLQYAKTIKTEKLAELIANHTA